MTEPSLLTSVGVKSTNPAGTPSDWMLGAAKAPVAVSRAQTASITKTKILTCALNNGSRSSSRAHRSLVPCMIQPPLDDGLMGSNSIVSHGRVHLHAEQSGACQVQRGVETVEKGSLPRRPLTSRLVLTCSTLSGGRQ